MLLYWFLRSQDGDYMYRFIQPRYAKTLKWSSRKHKDGWLIVSRAPPRSDLPYSATPTAGTDAEDVAVWLASPLPRVDVRQVASAGGIDDASTFRPPDTAWVDYAQMQGCWLLEGGGAQHHMEQRPEWIAQELEETLEEAVESDDDEEEEEEDGEAGEGEDLFVDRALQTGPNPATPTEPEQKRQRQE